MDVASLYAPVACCDLADADLCAFLQFLYDRVLELRPRVVVQTGTGVGLSAVAIALGLADVGGGTLYTIDPEPDRYHGVPRPVSIARRVVAQAGLGNIIRFIVGYSTIPLDAGRMALVDAPTWRLSWLRRRRAWDMLVIDGDHTLIGCYLDLVVGSGGLAQDGPRAIVCHDYLGIATVRRAIDHWAHNRLLISDRIVRSRCGIRSMRLPRERGTGVHR